MAKSKKTGLGTAAFFETASQQDGEPVEQQDSKPARRRSKAPTVLGEYINGEKVKATYYLSEETLQRLEEAIPRLKRQAGIVHKEKRRLVTKSLIVEAALQIVLDELTEKETEAALNKMMTLI